LPPAPVRRRLIAKPLGLCDQEGLIVEAAAVQTVVRYSRWLDVPGDLRTRTQLKREGRKVPRATPPRAYFDSYWYGRTYELFSVADTVPIIPRLPRKPAVLSFADESIVSAIQTINDAAKRRRDGASTAYSRRQHGRAQRWSGEKAAFYELKDAVLGRLIEQGRATVVGHHSKTDRYDPPKPYVHGGRNTDFNDAEDDDWSDDQPEYELIVETAPPKFPVGERTTVLQAIRFAGYGFHRPIEYASTDVTIDSQLGDRLSPARPLGPIRLRDAEATLRAYLMQPRLVLPCAVVALSGSVPEGDLIKAVAVPWVAICRGVAHDPNFLYQFAHSPRKFEEFIAACYDRAGFDEVVLTPRSGDLGRDVIALKRGHLSVRFLDQCKAYSANHVVPANDVRAMLGVITGDRNTSKGFMTTTATFASGIDTDPIISPYVPHRLELRDGRRLREWLLTLLASDDVTL
jgi:restriction system protein